jgi:hypothetical protein
MTVHPLFAASCISGRLLSQLLEPLPRSDQCETRPQETFGGGPATSLLGAVRRHFLAAESAM